MTRILIKKALIVDGTESPSYRSDVLINEGRIVAIESDLSAGSVRVLNAEGLALSPGFIDMHAHSDLQILADTDHMAKVSQGVTTELIGHDGFSYAPVDDETLAVLRPMLAGLNANPDDFDFSWRSVADYLDRLDEGIAGNAAYLIPHSVVRARVLGWDNVQPNQSEIARMQSLVRTGMEEGAVGLSAGLTYAPGSYATNDELISLCNVVGEMGGFFSPHHRSYGKGAIEAYSEMIDVARHANCSLHLTHSSLLFAPNKGRADELLSLIDEALALGSDISLDTYPYLASSTALSGLLPGWSSAGGPHATLARLQDPEALARIREDMEVRGSDGSHGVVIDWSVTEVSGVTHPDREGLSDVAGRSLAHIAEERSASPFDVFVEILVRDELGAGVLQHNGDEENIRTIMQHSRHTGGSDGILVGERLHPRSWGTFPRYVGHYSRDVGLFSLEECVGHLTGRAARRLQLRDRGLVKVGHAADLVLFDPLTIADTATYERPIQQATGIPYVFVNGEIAVEDGQRTDILAGRALRRRSDGTVS